MHPERECGTSGRSVNINFRFLRMFAYDIVRCGDDEIDMSEYLETWRSALEDRGVRISRPKTQ